MHAAETPARAEPHRPKATPCPETVEEEQGLILASPRPCPRLLRLSPPRSVQEMDWTHPCCDRSNRWRDARRSRLHSRKEGQGPWRGLVNLSSRAVALFRSSRCYL